MRILRLLNKKYFSIILILLFGVSASADEKPVDIWNIEKEKIEENSIESNGDISQDNIEINENFDSSVYNMQSQKEASIISLEEKLEPNQVKIIGLYDPGDYGLDINMWSNSNGDQLKSILKKLNSMDLSRDAIEIINISLLTNAHRPQKNISEKEFLKFKSEWLIKNSNLKLIEDYLIQNKAINLHPDLTKFIVDHYLSYTNIDKACEIFFKYDESFNFTCALFVI